MTRAARGGGASSAAARRKAAHAALLPKEDSDVSYDAAEDEDEESSDEQTSEEDEARTAPARRSKRRVSSGSGAKKAALQALRAARERSAAGARRRTRALLSSDDDEPAPAAPHAAARARRSAPSPKSLPEEAEDEEDEDEDEREWERRRAGAAPRRGDYQYRKHVTGLKLERLSADEASASDMSDFIASDEEEDEEDESEGEEGEEEAHVTAPQPRRGVAKRLRVSSAAGPGAAPGVAVEPATVAAHRDALEDDDDDELGGIGGPAQARRRSRVIADDDDEEEDVPIAAALGRSASAVATESTAAPKRRRLQTAGAAAATAEGHEDGEAATGAQRKRLSATVQQVPDAPQSAGRLSRRQQNRGQTRAQDALARLLELRGKEHGARRIDEQLRATGALPAAEASDESSSESDDAPFCVSDEDDQDGAAALDDDDSGVVACVCGATSADDDGIFLQCANGMCRVWAHAACCGFKTREEAEAAVFFCKRCQPAAEALLEHAPPGTALPPGGFAPVASLGADVAPSEAATRAWRAVHGARDVGAVLASALAADQPSRLRALLLHSRPGALKMALTHNHGATLLQRAASAGAVQCTRMLLRTAGLPVPESSLGTPVAAFCTALESAKPGVARAVLQEVPGLLALASRAGASEDGGTALHAAATGGDLECMRMALPPGAAAARDAASATDSEGTTPLMFAAARSRAAVCLLLDLFPVDPVMRKALAAVDANGQNACHYAASAGQADAVLALADAWPSLVHGRDSHGSTPLHLAAAEGRGAAIRALLRRQASVTSKDNSQWIPLMYADVADAEGTLALLEHQPEAQLSLMAGVLSDSRSEARVLKILRALAESPPFFAVLNAFLRSRIHLLSGTLSFILRRPAVLDVANKQRYFKAQLASFLRSQPPIDEGEETDDANVLWVTRDTAFQDWAAWCLRHGVTSLRRPMWHRLRLTEAPASIGAGVERDTLELMAACLAVGGLLAPTAEGGRALAPTPGAMTATRRAGLVALGWLLGYCLLHERTLPLPLEAPFLRALLGRKTTSLVDLEAVDPMYHRSLQQVLAHMGADDLGLTFALEEGGQSVELVPGGTTLAVTDSNKEDFVAAAAAYKLHTRTAEACACVREGLTAVVPAEFLRVFHEGDLALLLGGSSDVDLADWRAQTLYEGFARDEPLVAWFWKCVANMTREERALLLRLATGSSRVPIGGFASLQGLSGPHKFTLMRIGGATCSKEDAERLPSASTCFNTLKLPAYPSCEHLERKLLSAVRFGAGGFEYV